MGAIMALHGGMQRQFHIWSQKHVNEGYLLFCIAGCAGGGDEPVCVRPWDLGGCFRSVYMLSRVDMQKRVSVVTSFSQKFESGELVQSVTRDCPIKV